MRRGHQGRRRNAQWEEALTGVVTLIQGQRCGRSAQKPGASRALAFDRGPGSASAGVGDINAGGRSLNAVGRGGAQGRRHSAQAAMAAKP